LPEKLKQIDQITDIFAANELSDYDPFGKKVNEQIKIVNEKLFPKREALPNLLNRILQREHAITKRISNVYLQSEGNTSEGSTSRFSKEFK
jgi:hypothetical protein